MFLIADLEAVLRRSGWRGDETRTRIGALRQGDEKIEQKLRRAFHDRPGLFQVFEIAAEGKMLPEVPAHPRAGHGEKPPADSFAGRSKTPRVVNRVHRPPARAVMRFGGFRARLDHPRD